MSTPKQRRRNVGAKKLEPIDWHEFANDAVLNGNMSTLYRRPPTEDSTGYASSEALAEIDKRLIVGLDRSVGVRATADCAGASGEVQIGAPGRSVPTVGTD